jgi:hypothetical protein
MAILPAADIPDRLERMDPASDALDAGSRIRAGGAKSKAVNKPDLRRAWLYRVSLAEMLGKENALTDWA